MPPKPAPTRKRLTVDLAEEEHRALKLFAVERGVSMSELVIETLRHEGLLSRTKQGARTKPD